MSNEFYDHTTYPATNSSLSSAALRAELDSVEAGFDKLPTLAGNANKVVKVNGAAGAMEAGSITDDGTDITLAGKINKVTITPPATGSTLTIANGKTLTASNTLTLTATDGSTLAIGTGGTLGTAAYTNATAYQTAQSVTGLVKSSGTTRSAATVRVDYAEPTTALATGILKNTTTTGAHTIAVAGTDYQAPIGTISGLVKGNGANALTAAVVRTDYAEPTTALATGLLKNTTTTGAHSIAVVRTDYAEPTTALATGILYNTTTTGAHSIATTAQIGTAIGVTGLMKGNGAAAITAATVRTDYAEPTTALATGILYNTTTTGAHSIATAAQIGTAINVTGMVKGAGAAALAAATAGTDYVAPGTATNFTATQRADYNTASATSSYNFAGADQIVNISLTTATTVTFGAPSGLVTGAYYTFILTAGDTSARTYAWNAAYKFPAATSPLTTATTTSGACDIITFIALSATTAAYIGHQADLR